MITHPNTLEPGLYSANDTSYQYFEVVHKKGVHFYDEDYKSLRNLVLCVDSPDLYLNEDDDLKNHRFYLPLESLLCP